MRLRAMPTCRGLEIEPGRPRGPGPTFSEVAGEWWGSRAQKRSARCCRDSIGEGPQALWRRKGRIFRKGRAEMQPSQDKTCVFQEHFWRQEESYDTQKYKIMIGGKDSRLLEGDSGGSCSLYIVTKAWASKRGPSGNTWRSWHFLALLS